MKPEKTRYTGNVSDYNCINAVVALTILLLLLSVKFSWLSIHCVYAQQGGSCTTCGLTTAFRNLLNGTHAPVRPDFMALFVLFAGQLAIRPVVSLLLVYTSNFTVIRNSDVAVTVGLFIAFLVL